MYVARVELTPAAHALLQALVAEHGPVVFHQSGGCCDGSAPMCFPAGELAIGEHDVYLGSVAGCPFYMGELQFEHWQHTHLTLDVLPGRGGSFSLEAPRGLRFHVRSRLFTDEEHRALEAAGPPPRGPR